MIIANLLFFATVALAQDTPPVPPPAPIPPEYATGAQQNEAAGLTKDAVEKAKALMAAERERHQRENNEMRAKAMAERTAEPTPAPIPPGKALTLTEQERNTLQALPLAIAQCVGALKLRQKDDDICASVAQFVGVLAERSR